MCRPWSRRRGRAMWGWCSSLRLTTPPAMRLRDRSSKRGQVIHRERERVVEMLRRTDGVTAYRSDANFILFRTELPAAVLFLRLLQRGALVRDVSHQPMLERCLRVTIGMPDENDRFLGALRASMEAS